jgi:hypothetical protein
MVSQSDEKSFLKDNLPWNPSDSTSDSRAAVNWATKSCPKEGKNAKPSIRIQICPYPGRLAYIHAHPLMIVGIDTIASDEGGHRGTGGGGGEEQGWIIVQGKYLKCYVRW